MNEFRWNLLGGRERERGGHSYLLADNTRPLHMCYIEHIISYTIQRHTSKSISEMYINICQTNHHECDNLGIGINQSGEFEMGDIS